MKSPRVLISASAGSGKTYRLVHHFLGVLYEALLAPGRDRQPRVVERILAATFTRSAAGEIIDRILRRVAEAMLDPAERAELCEALAAENLGEEDCGILLAALVTALHRLRVGTLDSFLIRSAQAFSTELGLPDNWNILDDAADAAVSLEAIDQLLTEKAADDAQFKEMVELLLMLNQRRFTLQIRQRLMEHLQSTHAALLAGDADAWEVIGPDAAHLLPTGEIDRLSTAFPVDAEPFLPLSKSTKLPNANWVKAIVGTTEKARSGDWESLLAGGLVGAMSCRPCSYYKIELPPELMELLLPFRNHACAALLKLLQDRNRSTRNLLTEFAREYKLAKARQASYRFDDFTLMLLDGKVTDDMADFYFRLDGSIDHILLDEFQDTSVPQWKLIEPLVDEIMSGGEGAAGAQRTFFCVGDIKQTLYGWRNAEPELLNTMPARWDSLDQQYLLVSQRSSPVIIETVNDIFGALVRNAALVPGDAAHSYLADAAKVWDGWFKEHDTARRNVAGFCRLLTCGEGESTAELQAEAVKSAADRVAELHRAQPEAEIAVLVRRRKFIGALLGSLRGLDIAASGEGGSPLADDLGVCAVLSLLHLIDHPSDSAAVFHVGSSPLGKALGFSAESARNEILKTTTELRTEILDRGLGAAINRWLGLIAESCDARNFRRLQRLISVAHGYDYDGGDLRPFIDTVRATNVEDSEASKVRVMTIHASKGRQFDYVILPDLDGRFAGQNPSVLLNRPDLRSAANCITTYPSAGQIAADPWLAKLSADAKRRKVVEELCALYVAVTRAKSGLEMIVHPQSPNAKGNVSFPASPAGVLRAALWDGPAPANTVLWTHPDSVIPGGPGRVPESDASKIRGTGGPPVVRDEKNHGRAAARLSSSKSHATIPEELPAILRVRLAPTGADSRLRPVLAPSALEGSGYIHLGRMLSFSREGGKDWGSVLHRWFEMIEWIDGPLPSDNDLRDTAQALALDVGPGQIQTMMRHFREACDSPSVRRLMGRQSYLSAAPAGATVQVWRERPFAVPYAMNGVSGSAVVSGRVDRVVVIRSEGRAIAADVIDFKTDLATCDTVGERTAFYAPQLRAYREAVASLLHLDVSAVTAKLAFVGSDLVSKVS